MLPVFWAVLFGQGLLVFCNVLGAGPLLGVRRVVSTRLLSPGGGTFRTCVASRAGCAYWALIPRAIECFYIQLHVYEYPHRDIWISTYIEKANYMRNHARSGCDTADVRSPKVWWCIAKATKVQRKRQVIPYINQLAFLLLIPRSRGWNSWRVCCDDDRLHSIRYLCSIYSAIPGTRREIDFVHSQGITFSPGDRFQ